MADRGRNFERLVQIVAVCAPGDPPVISRPELADVREGDYPGQIKGRLRRGSRWLDFSISPDRVGKIEGWVEGRGNLVFGAAGWDFEDDERSFEKKVLHGLKEAMEQYAAEIRASADMIAELAASNGNPPRP